MASQTPLRGLTTVAYQSSDLAAATRWYSELLGVEPYFQRQEYVEFRIGDYQHEFGILDSRYLPDLGADGASAQPGGAIVYWHVDDVEGLLERLQQMGAKLHHPPRDFGEGFVGASVTDPFGNILGIMRNPHYFEVLGRRRN